MKQYTENQYDDDLTVGTDDYDDSYYTGSVDLFEFSNNEESPISRLKSLILSIDWEITDEILMQFNEELVDLKDIWAGEKINLVYVQALEKISKYIYQKKADSHPSAIKLLLTLYHNLEKVVSSFDLTEEQKKEILLEDIKRFESLKRHIGKQSKTVGVVEADQQKTETKSETKDRDSELLNLKAIVLSIDWEITDQDLIKLRQEVVRLEEKFADSKPRLILLQGIDTLGAYIKLKKSNANPDAFKLLHLFYESLEKIVVSAKNIDEEKKILFPAVERFNAFKVLLTSANTPEAKDRDEGEADDVDNSSDSAGLTPAFSDLPEEEVVGFQAEKEAKALGLDSSGNVDNHVDTFFTGMGLENSEDPASVDVSSSASTEKTEMALQGVDVEEDDDEDQGPLSKSGTLSPALSEAIEENGQDELSPASLAEEVSQDEKHEVQGDSLEKSVAELTDNAVGFLSDDDNSEVDFSTLDKDTLLQGVDVETEADDDSDEEALPLMEGELAPALAENDEISLFNAGIFEADSDSDLDIGEIDGTLGGFFDEEIESHLSLAPKEEDEDLDLASEVAESEIKDQELASSDYSSPSLEEDSTDIEEQVIGGDIEEDDFTALTADTGDSAEEEFLAFEDEETEEDEEDIDLLQSDTDQEKDGEAIAFSAEFDMEDSLDSFFDDGSGNEQVADHPIEEDVVPENSESVTLEEDAQQESSTKVEEQLDSFFDVGEDFDQSEDDTLLSVLPEESFETVIGAEDDIVASISNETGADEVVFELAEDVEPLAKEEPDIDRSGQVASDKILHEEKFSEEGEISSTEQFSEENDSLKDSLSPALETDNDDFTYEPLQTCVDSLGIELDDKVILGLFEQIDLLDQNLADKPQEKTFLKLLSTIARHIDQNRYDSSSDTYVLLQSVCTALTQLQEDDLQKNQEMLLTETSKVLEWQEKVMAEQTARNEAELTIGDSVLSDQEAMIDDVDELLHDYEGDSPLDQSGLNTGEGRLLLSDDLKKEISTLRQTLQDEIAELRKEFKGNNS